MKNSLTSNIYIKQMNLPTSLSVDTRCTMNPLDPEEFRRQGHMVIDFLADYYKSIENFPVQSQVQPGSLIQTMPESAPFQPESLETILCDVQNHIIPSITHWQSPGFFAYFQSNASTANFLGEMLLTGFNAVGFNWVASPAATELEIVVMEWLLKLLQLPESFSFSSEGGGVIHGSTCESFVCTLIAARERMLNRVGKEKIGKLVVYCSDQTHFSFQKAAQVVGINPSNVRAVPTTKATNFELSPDLLNLAIQLDVKAGLIPFYLCATVGTTSTTAVDPLQPLCDVAKVFNMWVHVDAAYAGSACICPEFRHFLDGVEGASSFSFNPHKWFLTTLDCCCLWVKDRSTFTKGLSTNPELLKNKASEAKQVVDYKDWQISLSRRFRAMKLWMVMRSYGVSGIRDFIMKHVKLAKYFEMLVAKDKRFEIVAPRNFSLVCFRISPLAVGDQSNGEDLNELNRKLLELLNASGRVYMIHTVIEGIYVIRVAIGSTLTEERHVSMLWELVQEGANALLDTYAPKTSHAINEHSVSVVAN